jgi:DNA (cytosine-5)-methyltransferase 1
MAGYKVLWASEFIHAAAQTYRANHPHTILDTRDIRTVQPAEILESAGLKVGELDLFDGSPPCASFSTAGKREKGWGEIKKYSDTAQRVDDLFFEYVRLVEGLKPRVFVAENVSGLVKGVAKGYFLEILAKLKACGYRVGCKVLDAQWLAVPQARRRTIFIGVREDLGKEPVFPKPLPYRYTVRDALPDIIKAKYGPTWRSADAPSPTVSAGLSYNPATSHQNLELVEARITGGTGAPFDHKGKAFSLDEPAPTILGTKPNQLEVEQLDMSRFAIAKEWDKLKPGESSDRYFNLVRPHPDQPCPTICASHGHPGIASVTHPTEKRKLTIGELKRICAFPDDFILTGTYGQQWERLGRAVPPAMMFHIAEVIRDQILNTK